MKSNMAIPYDQMDNILYIDQCLSYPEQESAEMGNEIIGRLNPDNDNIENIKILFFSIKKDYTT